MRASIERYKSEASTSRPGMKQRSLHGISEPKATSSVRGVRKRKHGKSSRRRSTCWPGNRPRLLYLVRPGIDGSRVDEVTSLTRPCNNNNNEPLLALLIQLEYLGEVCGGLTS